MKILAFDTSNQALSVALAEDGDLIADIMLTIKKNHSVTLMPAIDFVMAAAGWQPRDLDRIVVAQGPGSYTGLRITVATAKTMAMTLGCGLVGVSSLRSLVPDGLDGLVVPLINARRQAVYAGFYKDGESQRPDAYMPLEEVLNDLAAHEHVYLTGEAMDFEKLIYEKLPHAHLLPTLPSAFDIAMIGAEMTSCEPHGFNPVYLKRVEAEEKWLEDHEPGTKDYISRI